MSIFSPNGKYYQQITPEQIEKSIAEDAKIEAQAKIEQTQAREDVERMLTDAKELLEQAITRFNDIGSPNLLEMDGITLQRLHLADTFHTISNYIRNECERAEKRSY